MSKDIEVNITIKGFEDAHGLVVKLISPNSTTIHKEAYRPLAELPH